MAAIVGKTTEVGLERIGGSVIVPDDPRALLMFYLKSICDVMDINDPGLQRLTNYQNYRSLQDSELKILMFFCALLSPDELEGKCIFEDADGSVCGEKVNQFCELSAVQNQFLVSENILIGNQQRHIKKVMFYRPVFIQKYYQLPLIKIKLTMDLLEAAEEHPFAVQHQQRQIVITQQPSAEPYRSNGTYKKRFHEKYLINLCICLFFPPWCVCWFCMCLCAE